MIIIQVMGGLGNQLQQYALYRKLNKLGKDVKLDISWFEQENIKGKEVQDFTRRELELTRFQGLKYEICTRQEREKLIGNGKITGKLRRKLFPASVRWFRETDMYHPEIFMFEDQYLSGYFACEKYFADILKELRKELQFPPSTDPQNEKFAEEMQNCESVSVHIRRGDYLSRENAAMFGGICTEEYYQRAFSLIREKCQNPHFYLFSDDPGYIEQHAKGTDITVVDVNHGRDSFYDMWLMSHCRHHICANSTFSFWGARLDPNDKKIMIRPTIQKNVQIFEKETMEELWKGWTFISPQGILM